MLTPSGGLPRPRWSGTTRLQLDAGAALDDQPFVGRVAELARLRTLTIGPARALAILGPPGIGKSRLAHRFALIARDGFDGAWLCDLRSSANVEEALLLVGRRVLGDPQFSSPAPLRAICRALATRGSSLLVLDEADRLGALLHEPLTELLRAASELRIVLVARRLAPIAAQLADAVMTVGPLGVSDSTGEPGGEAGRFFIERVRALLPGWSPDLSEARALDQLVRRLSAVPLALELAAARASLDGVHAALCDLHGDSPRHEAGEAGAVARAFGLLRQPEREVLAQCSAFAGSFGIDAALRVVQVAGGTDVAELLVSLARRHVIATPGLAPLRLALPASIAERAARELGTRSPFARHAAYFTERATAIALADPSRPASSLPDAHDQSNLESALAWAHEHQASEQVLRLCVALDALAAGAGLPKSAALALDDALVNTGKLDAALVARARGVRVRVQLAVGRLADARDEARSALSFAEASGDRRLQSAMLVAIATACFQLGELTEALRYGQRSLERAEAAGDRIATSAVMHQLGSIHQSLGDRDRARVYYEGALAIAIAAGDGPTEARAAMGLGSHWLEAGDLSLARAAYERARALTRTLRLARPLRIVTAYLGLLAFDAGDLDDADALLSWAAERSGEAGDLRVEGIFLGFRAAVMARAGRRTEARWAFERARALLVEHAFFHSVIDLFRGHLDLADAIAARNRGDAAAASAHLLGAQLRIEEASAPGDASSGALEGDRRSLIERSDDARIGLRILRRALDELEAPSDG